MRLTEVGAPVTAAHRDDAELGDDDGGADGGRDFLGGLDAETDVALGVTNDDDGLETGALAGTGLLLDGLDLFGGELDVRDRLPERNPKNPGARTFITSSLSLGRKKSTIWYSLMGSEWR